MAEAEPLREDMQDQYDFSDGVRGKHSESYRSGHTVRVHGEDGQVTECHYSLEEGAVMLDPDLKAKFPTSELVNQALRSLDSQQSS